MMKRLFFLFALVAVPAFADRLHLVKDVPLPGAANRFDYQSLDLDADLLFITHLAGDSVVIFDLKKGRVVQEVTNLAKPHGALWVKAHRRLYVTATGSHEVACIEPQGWTVEARLPGGDYPDGLAYDPVSKRIFVSDEHGGASVILDPLKKKLIKTVALGGNVGNTQYDAKGRQILVAVGETNELVALDPEGLEIRWRAALTGGQEAHGVLVHPEERVAYVACQSNNTLIEVNLQTQKVTKVLATGKRPDVLAYDAGLRRLYVGCEGGQLAIFQIDAKGHASPLETLDIPHAHTVAVDPRNHRVYLPIENLNGRPVLRILEP